MLHTDIPTHADIESLMSARSPGSVSIYLPTTPITTDIGSSRIELELEAVTREGPGRVLRAVAGGDE